MDAKMARLEVIEGIVGWMKFPMGCPFKRIETALSGCIEEVCFALVGVPFDARLNRVTTNCPCQMVIPSRSQGSRDLAREIILARAQEVIDCWERGEL